MTNNKKSKTSLRGNLRIVLILLTLTLFSSACSARLAATGACKAEDGCLYTAFNGNKSVRVLGFSPDGSRFLTDGTSDGIIHDAGNGKKISSLDEGRENHSYNVSGDRNEIIAYRQDSVKFFDWEGELLRTWTPNSDESVRDAAFVPSVDGFVIAGKGGVSLWKLSDGSLIIRLVAGGGIMDVAASAAGETIAAYNFVEDEIAVWPLQNLDDAVVIPGVDALSIHLSTDGNLLAAGGPAGAWVWQTADGSLVTAVEPEGMKATAASMSHDGSLLAVGFENGIVTVWDVNSEELTHTFEHENPANQITFAPDGDTLLVGLDYDVQVSGGELVFGNRLRDNYNPILRQDRNRISTSPGYAIVWSVEE